MVEPDVAEIEERRVGKHVRVLEARIHPRAVERRDLGLERRGDEDEEQGEEARNRAQDRNRPGKHGADQPPVQGDGGRAHAREDEEPEEERPLLPAPEGRERVAKRQLAARVRGDVREAEVVARERGEQDDARRAATLAKAA